jgi:hypothetical protein
MKDQVILGVNGELAIAVPLFRRHHEEELVKLDGYTVSLTSEKPLAYILDMGTEDNCPIVNNTVIESQCEFLGDL